jgi:flagellar protein FliO/FliZ
MNSIDYDTYLRGLAALVAVLGLIAGAAWVARRMGFGGARSGMRRDRRLAISEVMAVDNRRRLVLIKRDSVEHLILIGGSDDVVVERGIVPALPSGLPKVFEERK